MMSWQPRMILRKLFIFGPRTGAVSRVVRMWNDSGNPSSTAASQNGS